MLVDKKDKSIGSPEYWDEFFKGTGKEGKVKQSDGTVKPAVSHYDRIGEMLTWFDGSETILDVGCATANFAKRWTGEHKVVAVDHSPEAKKKSGYEPFIVASAYKLPFADKEFDVVMCTQSLEYMDDDDKFFKEAKRIGHYGLFSVPLGEMGSWSQYRIYNSDDFISNMYNYGNVEETKLIEEQKLLIVKVNFDFDVK